MSSAFLKFNFKDKKTSSLPYKIRIYIHDRQICARLHLQLNGETFCLTGASRKKYRFLSY